MKAITKCMSRRSKGVYTSMRLFGAQGVLCVRGYYGCYSIVHDETDVTGCWRGGYTVASGTVGRNAYFNHGEC